MINKTNIISFCEQLSSYKIVSFDLFDTLMFRTFSNYEMVHQAVAICYQERHHENMKDYPQKRIYAEHVARKEHSDRDVNLKLIYDYLDYDLSKKNELLGIEEEIEVKNCLPNKFMVEVARWCKQVGKQVVITTDMYLPREVLNKILVKIGVKYDNIFISGEEGPTKRNGGLFKVLLDRLDILPQDVIHIGDDLNNDIIKPKEYGIASLERIMEVDASYPSYWFRHNDKTLVNDHLVNLINKSYDTQYKNSSEYRIGYTIIGPLLVNFCIWLHEKKIEWHLQKLLFVAREGFLIKKIYTTLFPDENDQVGYVRINKNILRLPLLTLERRCEYFNRAKLGRPEYDWKTIFDMLYIENKKKAVSYVKLTCPSFSYHDIVTINDLEAGKYDDILNCLFDFQKDKISKQADLLYEYFVGTGLTSSSIGLVNNSINGSGQSMMEDFLKSKGFSVNIHGLQFLKNEKCQRLLGDRCDAWLSQSDISKFAIECFWVNSLLFEHLLFEPCGTSINLYQEIDSDIRIKCESPRVEQKNFETISLIQGYALDFASLYKDNIDIPLGYQCFYPYYAMLLNPLYEDAFLLCNLYDDDVDGDKKISDVNVPLKFQYIFNIGIPFEITWKIGYFVLKKVPKLLIYLYIIRLKYAYVKDKFKKLFKNIILK